MEEPPMTEEDYFAAAYEEELAMEEEARAATNEAPAAAAPDDAMDTAEPAEADKPKGVFDWRERDDFGEEGRMLLRRIYKYMKALPNYRLGTPGLYHYTSVT